MKVILYADCNFVGCRQEEEVEVPDDTSDEELRDIAEQFMWDNISPESWFEKVEE
jgi:hypothetical protein